MKNKLNILAFIFAFGFSTNLYSMHSRSHQTDLDWIEKRRQEITNELKESILNSLIKIGKNIENLYFNNPSRMSKEYLEELIKQKLELIKKNLMDLIGRDFLLSEVQQPISIENIYNRVLKLKLNYEDNEIDLYGKIIDDLYAVIRSLKREDT